MKIGILTSSVSRRAGGIFNAVRSLSQSLSSSQNCWVEVFGLEDDCTAEDQKTWGTLSTKIASVRGPTSFSYAPALETLLHDANLNLLHTHGLWMYPSVAGLQWARRRKNPYLVTPHGMLDPWAVGNARWKKRLAGWLYENAHLHGATCVHALCEAEVHAIRTYGLKNPICLIPNGVEIPKELAADAPSWKEDVPAGSKILLYLGRLHPKKGLVNLLLAWDIARRKEPRKAADWCLAVAGWDQNGHEDELRTVCKKLCVESSVRFVGPQFGIDKHKTYYAASVFILPSLSEGLPVAVLEAWSYRLPVLMTSQCNLPEGVRAEAALQIEPEPNTIARSLIELFSMSDSERAAIGRRGRQLVEMHFSWPKIAEELYSVYEWMLGGGNQPACIISS